MLATHGELQQCLGETGVESLFKDTPGFSLGFMVPKAGHQVGGLKYFFDRTVFVSYLLYTQQHKLTF